MSRIRLTESRSIPVEAAAAFDAVLSLHQRGSWDSVGQTRTLRSRNSGSMRVELTSLNRPHWFGYRLSEFSGPMGLFVASVEGCWTFERRGDSVRITRTWTLNPTTRTLGLWMVVVLGRLWRSYAQRTMDSTERLLLVAHPVRLPPPEPALEPVASGKGRARLAA